MKNFLPSLLPALALLTLGGCAGTSALSSTENDGVYYSSQDRTIQNATASAVSTSPATEAESGDEISNPDYATTDGQRSSTVTESTEYYDDDYAYSSRIRRFHQPYYRGFGYGYNDFVYADPFWYGGSSYYGNSFYDPFYGPGYGYGGFGSYANIGINIGFGNPWGWGYNPWRYGRGYGLFDNYYGGGYGYGGFGGYGGYGYNNYYNVNNYYGSGSGLGSARNVRYGPRNGRSAEAGTAGRTSTGTGNVTGSRSRATEGGIAAPTGGRSSTGGVVDNGTPQSSGRGRSRSADAGTLGGVLSEGTLGGREAGTVTDQQVSGRNARYRQNANVAEQINSGGTVAPPSYEIRGRRRAAEAVGNVNDASTQPAQPQYSQPRRTRFSELNTNQSSGQSAEQPVRRQRTYEAPQRTYETPQRTYEQPARTYEAPQRSYSEPSRSSSSFPSSGGNSGGGNSGGSNSGGGGRGRGRD